MQGHLQHGEQGELPPHMHAMDQQQHIAHHPAVNQVIPPPRHTHIFMPWTSSSTWRTTRQSPR